MSAPVRSGSCRADRHRTRLRRAVAAVLEDSLSTRGADPEPSARGRDLRDTVAGARASYRELRGPSERRRSTPPGLHAVSHLSMPSRDTRRSSRRCSTRVVGRGDAKTPRSRGSSMGLRESWTRDGECFERPVHQRSAARSWTKAACTARPSCVTREGRCQGQGTDARGRGGAGVVTPRDEAAGESSQLERRVHDPGTACGRATELPRQLSRAAERSQSSIGIEALAEKCSLRERIRPSPRFGHVANHRAKVAEQAQLETRARRLESVRKQRVAELEAMRCEMRSCVRNVSTRRKD